MKNYNNIISLVNFDIINKLLIIKKSFFLLNSINLLEIYVILKNLDNNFYKNILYISIIFLNLFNQKIQVLQVKKQFIKGGSKLKNSLQFKFGLCITKKQLIYKNINFLLNIIQKMSYNIDNNFYKKNVNNTLFFYFLNVNYFLGLNTDKFYNLNINFFFVLKFNKKKISNNIIKFYEKIF